MTLSVPSILQADTLDLQSDVANHLQPLSDIRFYNHVELLCNAVEEYRRIGAGQNYTFSYAADCYEQLIHVEDIVVGTTAKHVSYRPAIRDPISPDANKTINAFLNYLYEAASSSRQLNVTPLERSLCDNFLSSNRIWSEISENVGHFQSLTFVYTGLLPNLRFGKLQNLEPALYDELMVAQAIVAASRPASAARERARWMIQRIKTAIAEHLQSKPDQSFTLLSVASGSAEVELLAVASMCRNHPDLCVNLLLTDPDRAAHEFAMQVACELGLVNCSRITIVTERAIAGSRRFVDRIGQILRDKFSTSKPDLITMIGLLDYLDPYQIIKILTQLRTLSKPETPLLTALVQPLSSEDLFVLYDFFGWQRMHHLSTSEFGSCFAQSGYHIPSLQLDVTSPQTACAISLACAIPDSLHHTVANYP